MENKNKLLNDEKKILAQMMIKQRTKINKNYKLSISNLLKLIKNIDTSISPFDKNKCCIWKGYHVTNEKNNIKYTNFYLNNKKIALNRLLYINFVDDIEENSYLKYNCSNKGICCNINHIVKCNNNPINENNQNNQINQNNQNNKNNKNLNIINIKRYNNNTNNKKFIIIFD